MSSQADRALQPGGRAGNSSGLDRWLLRTMMAALPRAGYEVVLWDGFSVGDRTGLRVHILDRPALRQLVRNPSLHFGDLYSAGRIDVEGDLVAFLERTYAALEAGRAANDSVWWRLWADTAPHSSLTAAYDNIHRHYDLGNDFYAAWLDREAMQYTCAYFPEPGMTLEAAQRAKMDHVCRKLRLRPGQRVFEAGCGWGGFALHMAREYGVEVRAWNISREQIRYATERARRSTAWPAASATSRTTSAPCAATMRRLRVDRHARARRPGKLRHARRGHRPLPRAAGAGPHPYHRPQPPRADERLDRAAHLPGRAAALARPDDGDFRAARLQRARRGEPAAALRRDAAPLDRALPGGDRRGARGARRGLRARLAPVPRRLDRGVHDRHHAAVPGAVRARRATTTCRRRAGICTRERDWSAATR